MPDYASAHLCRCGRCGFVFARAIPTPEELERHYESYGRNDYLSPLTVKRYEELLDSFEPYRRTGRILDVGCGIGYFLEVAQRRGWSVHGTEYTDEAVKICRDKGIEVFKGALDPADFGVEFDVITSFEVLEHINNPRDELQRFMTLLRPGGLVYLTTPNFNSLLRYRLKAAFNVICYPEHLCYYAPRTLSRLFREAGFEQLKLQTTGVSLTRLKTSAQTSQEAFISADSTDERLRQRLENPVMQWVKQALNALLSLFGVGDTLKGWYHKPARGPESR